MIAGEIRRAIAALRLEALVRRVAEADAISIREAVHERFVRGGATRRWWEALHEPVASLSLRDGSGFERLLDLVPDPAAPCWFLVEDGGTALIVYEATPETVARLIAECFAFEYFIVSEDVSWLLCENHHGVLIGSGQPVADAMERLQDTPVTDTE